MSESVERLAPEIEADFLYNVTPKEFWDIYQDLKQRDCLLVWMHISDFISYWSVGIGDFG